MRTRIAKYMGLAALLLLLALALLGLLIQTHMGKDLLARQIGAIASPLIGFELKLSGLRGVLPFQIRLDELHLADEQGDFFTLSALDISLSPGALIRGQVLVNHLRIAHIALERTPESEAAPIETPPEPFAIPEIPKIPRWIALHELEVAEITLGRPLLELIGLEEEETVEAARFTLRGHLKHGAGQRGWDAALHLERLDADTTNLQLQAGMPEERLQLGLHFSDSAFAPALLNVEETLLLTLTGEGDASTWNGATALALGDATLLDGEIVLHIPDTGLGFDVALQAALKHALFPEALAEHLGETAAIQLTGSLSGERRLQLEKLTLEGEQVHLAAVGSVGLDDLTLDTRLHLTHHDIQPYLTDLDLQPESSPMPLEAKVNLLGPLESLEVEVESQLVEQELLAGTLTVQVADAIGVSGQLFAHPTARLLPEDLMDFLEAGAALHLAVRYHSDGLLDAEALRLEAAGLELTLEGHVHTQDPLADVRVSGHIEDAAPYGALLELDMAGAVALEGSLVGDADASRFNLTLQGDRWAYTDHRLEALRLTLDGTAGPWPDALLAHWEINADGVLRGAQVVDAPLADLTLQAALAGEGLEQLRIASLMLDDGNLSLNAAGDWRAGDAASHIDATLHIADLTPWSQLAALDIGGGLTLRSEVRSDVDTLARIDLALNATQLTGLPGPTGALVGTTPVIDAAFQFHDGILTLDNVMAQLAQGNIHLAGWIDTAEESLELNMELDFAQLDLGLDSGNRIQGRLDGRLQTTGSLDALAVSGTINGHNLGMDAFHADSLTLRIAMEGLPEQLQGRIQCDMTAEETPLTLEALFDANLPEVYLPRFSVQAPDNQLSGAVRWSLETHEGQGQVDVDFADLGVFEAFTNQPIGGRIQGNVALQATEGAATLDGDLELAALNTPWAQAENATVMLRAVDILGTPHGSLRLQANAVQVAELHWSDLQLQADGDPAGIQFHVTGEGSYQELAHHQMESAGNVVLGDEITAVLESFELIFDDRPFRLETPLDLQLAGNTLRLAPVRMDLAGGVLEARLLHAPESIDLAIHLHDLPLDLLQSFGLTPMEGQAHALVQVLGAPENPTATVEFELEGLRLANADVNAPPFDMQLESRLAEGQLHSTLTGTAADALELTGRGVIPLHFAIAPFTLEPPEAAQLDIRLDADINLGAIPAMTGLEDHVLEGMTQLWVTVQGPVANPALQGEVTLADGRYENMDTGTILEAIELLVELQPERITLTRFTAQDGAGGSLQGNGALELEPEADFPFAMDIYINRARLVHRDDASARSNGNLRIAGNSDHIQVSGDITVGPADITLPERLPPREMVVVEVEEVNRPDDWEPPPGIPAATAGTGPAIDLDIRTQIPNRVFVRGPGLESEWNGQLHLMGSAADPRIQGQLSVMRGHLDFLGRRFEFAESVISFDANTPPAPYLNVLATTDADDIEARLRITGPFDALNIELESEPFLPQDEILARVMFGRNLSDISPMQALQLARYASMLRGNVGGLQLLSAGGGGRLLGLDRFDFTRGATAEASTVGIGKYLSDEIYIEFVQGLSPESTKATVNVDLSPQIKLEGEVSAGARSGVGIFWKRDY